jgi:hypothetical protein
MLRKICENFNINTNRFAHASTFCKNTWKIANILVNTQLEESEISTEAKTSLAFFVVKKQNKKSKFI